MLNKKTVLILGAGASMPYGFPSGLQLKQTILNNLIRNPSASWEGYLNRQHIDKSTASQFADSFKRSGSASIDSFLATHSEYIIIGKICIALSLIPHEDESRLWEPAFKATLGWYEYLWNSIASYNNFISHDTLSIITFNYDRSLDYFLYNAAKHFYSNNKDVSLHNLLANIPIYHVYGQLGLLPHQEGAVRQYNPGLGDREIEIAWQSIKIISEFKNSMELKLIQSKLHDADQIFFLGFGYNEDNLKILKIDELRNKSILGSAYQLGMTKCSSITNNWGINLIRENSEILEFIKNYIPFN